MKTRKDAERVVSLSNQRAELYKRAGTVRMADEIGVCTEDSARSQHHQYGTRFVVFQFGALADELRDLIKREVALQIAEIDKELSSLGVAPDEFEAAAPEEAEPAPVKIEVVSRRRA